MRVVGVDGFKEQWLAVALVDGRFEDARLFEHLAELARHYDDARAIGVDIPIGSEPNGFRQADLAARSFVGVRRQSVFLTPPLEVLDFEEYAEANTHCRALVKKGFTRPIAS